MKATDLLTGLLLLAASLIPAALHGAEPSKSTRGAVERLMLDNPPRLAFDPSMTPEQAAAWRDSMGVAMTALMRHPAAAAAEPVLERSVQRDGYRLERWLTYPLPGYQVAVLLLIPDNPHPSGASVLCIPGFGQTKEMVAGELPGNFDLSLDADSVVRRPSMARQYAMRGLTAMAVDNPCSGELSDDGFADYLTSSRFLLELGWSYLGLASWQDRVALDLLRNTPGVDPGKVIVSGFSLGTEPMMALGLMDKDIMAFVYNDFMCRTRERALKMTARDENGRRFFPNNDEHLIPCFLTTFDFPDIAAAFAPRPLILTEGGLERDFALIRRSYELAGAPDAMEYHHYAKYADPANRVDPDTLPDGLDRTTFFRLVNVDPSNHGFKSEHIMPWLDRLLAR